MGGDSIEEIREDWRGVERLGESSKTSAFTAVGTMIGHYPFRLMEISDNLRFILACAVLALGVCHKRQGVMTPDVPWCREHTNSVDDEGGASSAERRGDLVDLGESGKRGMLTVLCG